jgi:transposase
VTKDHIKGQNIKVLDFPTYSPDLTPIENLWGALKRAVAADNPKTEKQLRESLLKHLEILTQVSNLKPYFDTLQDRFVECIDQEGVRLEY